MSAGMLFRPSPRLVEAEQRLEKAARRLADHIRAHPSQWSHVTDCIGPEECARMRKVLAADLLTAGATYLRNLP